MMRRLLCILAAFSIVSACAPPSSTGSNGQGVYRISRGDTSTIQFRMLDSVNALRSAAGQPEVKLNARLNAAAATHSRDMSIQNRPWHFGSDGSSPIDRIQRVGYRGTLVGETISETYETDIETLGAWMEKPDTRRVILSPQAREMGFSWFQENNGKIWWTLVMGAPGAAIQPRTTVSFVSD